MKENNHPLYHILLNHPSCFLEVKGEWSLARLTTLLTAYSKFDTKLATEKYRLVKEYLSSESLYDGPEKKKKNIDDYYSWNTKKISKDSPEVSILSNALYNLLRKIAFNKPSIYPKFISYKYGKKSSVKIIRPSEMIIIPIYDLNFNVPVCI
jgi:hypothetical protein